MNNTLTKETAPRVKSIRNIQHPEWGVKRFNYNEQPLNEGHCSTWGVGSNSAVLFEGEYKFWEVESC
jgi:hypothetical protein